MTLLRGRLAATVLVGTVALAACTDTGAEPGAGASADRASRVEAIRAARDVVVAPMQRLGTAAATVADRLDDAVQRRTAQDAAELRDALDALAEARDEVAAVDLPTPTSDVDEAAAALDDAVAAADDLGEHAARVATVVEVTADAIARLRDIVERWQERGSRSQVGARLDEAAATAAGIADDLDDPDAAPPGCPAAVEEVVDAATAVAQASRELAGLARAGEGTAFDERRSELADALFGVDDDQPVRLDDRITAEGCPALADATTAATAVVGAIQRLEAALNPPDLAR